MINMAELRRLYKNKNIQKHLVDLGLAKVYKKYAYQCNWSKII